MIIWVMYYIKKDRSRTKIAKLCKQAGLYRVQYSVFLETLDAHQKDMQRLQIEEYIDEEMDSVYIFPMNKTELQQTELLAQAFDKNLISDEVRALFFIENMSLPPSHIIEYLYCPRFTYFEYVLGIPHYETKNYKVMRGREIHDQKLERNKEYLRKKIGVQEKFMDQYLTNDLLRGRMDEVLLLLDGTMAPLDYKFAQYKDKVYETYRTQLFCYAWLIKQDFGKGVNKGFLVYTRSQNRLVEVPISAADKKEVEECARQILRVIDKNHFPKATKYRKRCLDCTYRNICIK